LARLKEVTPRAALAGLKKDLLRTQPRSLAEFLDATERTVEQLYAAAARPGGEAGASAVPEALRHDLDVPKALAIALDEGGAAARTLIEILALS
jgi:cysteinyl-tRNA synthetase